MLAGCSGTRAGNTCSPNFGAPEGHRTPAQVKAMTPEQRALHDCQQEPENQWSIHPLIDGCEPAERPPDIR